MAIVYYHLALSYIRIFPDLYELIELPFCVNNLTTTYHAGICNRENPLANRLLDFLQSEETSSIYQYHGLKGY